MAQTDGAAVYDPRVARTDVNLKEPARMPVNRRQETCASGRNMKRVTGIGGIFFKAKDPDKLRAWYREHLGIEAESWGYHFQWRDDPQKDGGSTVWSVFPESTKYFEPSTQPFMINF